MALNVIERVPGGASLPGSSAWFRMPSRGASSASAKTGSEPTQIPPPARALFTDMSARARVSNAKQGGALFHKENWGAFKATSAYYCQ